MVGMKVGTMPCERFRQLGEYRESNAPAEAMSRLLTHPSCAVGSHRFKIEDQMDRGSDLGGLEVGPHSVER